MTLKERVAVAKAVKWVDEVVEGVPYDVTVDFLDKIGCDFDAHGDDIAKNANGEDSNLEMKKAGRIKIFKRTEGVSTTDIVGRLLQITQLTHEKEEVVGTKPMKSGQYIATLAEARKKSTEDADEESKVRAVKFLATSRRLRQFSNTREPKPTDKIVYVAGSFDIFHCGDVEFLEKAKKMGDFLMVGIYDDKVSVFCAPCRCFNHACQTCREVYGKNFPLLSLHERVLNVLACKHADEVVIGAPWYVTEDLLKSFNIQLVVDRTPQLQEPLPKPYVTDNYQLAKEKGIYTKIELDCKITIETFIERIISHRDKFVLGGQRISGSNNNKNVG